MAYTPVQSLTFTASDGTAVQTAETSLSLVWGGSGFLIVNTNRCVMNFSNASPRMARDGGTYTDDQYIEAVVGGFTGGGSARYIMLAVQYGADTDAASDFYALRIFNDNPRTCDIAKYVNGSPTVVAGPTSIAWADNDVALIEIVGGVLSVYRDSGSGYGSAILTYDDSASPLTGGKPALGHRDSSGGPVLWIDTVEMGDVTSGGGSSIAAIFNHYRKLRA